MSRGTWEIPKKSLPFRLHGYHILWRLFPKTSARIRICNFSSRLQPEKGAPATPRKKRLQAMILQGLGCFHFARRYLGYLVLDLFS